MYKSNFHNMKTLTLFSLIAIFTLTLLSAADSANKPPFSCDFPTTKSFGFCQTTLSIQERARDLISRLTLDEMISQLVSSSPAIPRLGIAAYEWWSV
ncbi:hypothetical protein CASFOL_001124 [Castilleja foliolosa]|uniref:Uncharacterized protein n=1 Tax=Castilleja foliolosa TaxID=1961234 RepID=A0ABD3ELY1_9LAMI